MTSKPAFKLSERRASAFRVLSQRPITKIHSRVPMMRCTHCTVPGFSTKFMIAGFIDQALWGSHSPFINGKVL